MLQTHTNIKKTARIELRTTPQAKKILEEAASISHKGLTEFIIDQGIKKAEQLLADQRIFMLQDEQWLSFQAALDQPAQEKPSLKTLLSEKSVFEK